jgi:NAD dependent epimerase/dehydratase family enzyme
MKLILTGANGFIGTEILFLALAQKSVTSLITLSRKPLPAPYNTNTNPKLQSIILENFSSYPASVISQLSGADACIW